MGKDNIISEVVVRVNGKPVYSGTINGAGVAVHGALSLAVREGRSEPEIKVSRRTVDYDKSDSDPSKVTESPITI